MKSIASLFFALPALAFAWGEPEIPAFSQTSEYRMSGSLDDYATEECKRDGYVKCWTFVQRQPGAALHGFVFLGERTNGRVDVWSDTKRQDGQFCGIRGELINGRIDYTYQTGLGSAHGVFYIDRRGDRLRIRDERWNYCYPDRHIDDVFDLVEER